MKPGKISNTILKRTVIKSLTKKNNSIKVNKIAVGADAAIVRLPECEKLCMTDERPQLCMATDNGSEPLVNAVNNLAVAGAKAICAQLSVTMPLSAREIRLRELMEKLNAQSKELGVEITGGSTLVSGSVSEPVVSVTVTGMRAVDICAGSQYARPKDDIIVTKWIGISGIQRIIDRKREEILQRYTQSVITSAYGDKKDISIVKEAALCIENGVRCLHDVSTGGIFAALWDMAESSGVGIDVDFRKIPVCQEIIEICEMYDINPYELESSGCLLMTSDNGYAIVDILNSCGIPAAIIGKVTDSNDKLVRNEDEVRFLDMPKTDEIYKILGSESPVPDRQEI